MIPKRCILNHEHERHACSHRFAFRFDKRRTNRNRNSGKTKKEHQYRKDKRTGTERGQVLKPGTESISISQTRKITARCRCQSRPTGTDPTLLVAPFTNTLHSPTPHNNNSPLKSHNGRSTKVHKETHHSFPSLLVWFSFPSSSFLSLYSLS